MLGSVGWSSDCADCVGLCRLEFSLYWALSAGALTVLCSVGWSSDCAARPFGKTLVLPSFFLFCLLLYLSSFSVHTVQKSVTNKSISNLLHTRIKINK